MKAVNDYLIVEISKEAPTSGGLLLSDEDKNNLRHRKATVVSSSPLCKEQGNIQEGDTVYYDKSGSFTILVDGVQKTVIRLRDVVLVGDLAS